MSRLSMLVLASQIVMLGPSALANPVRSQVLRVREVPGGHVQLTYGVDRGSPKFAEEALEAPSHGTTFGTKSTPWKALATAFNTNTGSGITGTSAFQMCDCNVPVGRRLEYGVTVPSLYDGEPLTMTARLTTSGKYDAAAPRPSVPEAEEAPWLIPDPIEIQGLDCAAECQSAVPQGRLAASHRRCGSCSTADGGRPAGLVWLVLAVAIAWRSARRGRRGGSC